MTPQVNIPNATSRGVIAALRSPCAQNAVLKQGYSSHPQHLGQVLVFPSTAEPVVASGSGVVVSITSKNNTAWNHAAGDLDIYKTIELKLDHGDNVFTTVHGLASVAVVTGQYVTRGDTLGLPKTTEIFFQLLFQKSPLDPASYSVFFRGYDGGKVTGKARNLRPGPDFVSRDASDVVSYTSGGIRYFVDKNCAKPQLLVNVDFNGSGSKSGYAATGLSGTDYWNVYTPVVFSSESGTLCGTVLVPPSVSTGELSETSSGSISFTSGSIFETAYSGSGSEYVTNSATWLSGSTQTIPEIDSNTAGYAFTGGQVTETTIAFFGTDDGTNYVSFTEGTIAEAVVFAFGSTAPTSPVPYEESAGTATVSFFSGSLFDSVIFAFGTVSAGVALAAPENGTNYVSFVDGTIFELAIAVTFAESSSGSVSFTSGTIMQF